MWSTKLLFTPKRKCNIQKQPEQEIYIYIVIKFSGDMQDTNYIDSKQNSESNNGKAVCCSPIFKK